MGNGGTDLILPAGGEFIWGAVAWGLLWAAIPTIACISIAGQRGLRAGPAFMLGLIGGWLGLAIVTAFYKAPLIDAAPPLETPATAGPLVGGFPDTDQQIETPRARLFRLEELRDEGIITESEYSDQRRRILENI